MNLIFVQPIAELQPYIESFWIFESPIGFPAGDTSIAAPNGCAKLIIPYENSLISIADGNVQVSHEQRVYFVSNRDSATQLQSSPQRTGFIAIEFRPCGAYPIFGFPMAQASHGLWETGDLLNHWGGTLRERLANLPAVSQKVEYIQRQLLHLLRQSDRRSALVAHCVSILQTSAGLVRIRDLERQSGYSRRYLEMKFQQHVGLSPKVLAGIYRFQRFYRMWAENQPFSLLKRDSYEFYYDQAHFTKTFKRMTGHAPRKYGLQVANEFGRRLMLR
jgi:AraC-like DNA-binding protein